MFYNIFYLSVMSSSVCAHRLLLTKEALREYKYNHIIMNFAGQIRDTICSELVKPSFDNKQTKYAFRLDEQQQIGTYRPALQINPKSKVLVDVVTHLREYFPDSKITIVEQEHLNGFTSTQHTYIEVDWT